MTRKQMGLGALVVLVALFALWFDSQRQGDELAEVPVAAPDTSEDIEVVVVEEGAVPEADAGDAASTTEADALEADASEGDASEGDEAVAESAPVDDATDAEETAADAEASDPVSAASFDLVRVEPDGETVIAGQSTPGSTMRLMMDGETVGEASVDAGGNFVALLSLGASDTPRVLSMIEVAGDGTEMVADASVILAPSPRVAVAEEVETESGDASTEMATEEVASLETEDAATSAADTGQESAESTSESETQDADSDVGSVFIGTAPAATEESPEIAEEPEAPAAPTAPTVLLSDSEGVRVLQSGGEAPAVVDNVLIDAISYDSAGEVALTGRSTGDTAVRVYLDNQPILDVDVADGGQWRADLPDVDTGTYTLRVDELDDSGAVISRVETPFKREAVDAIKALDSGSTDAAQVALITVQPGNTLWGIAQERYGEGTLYVRVFEANSDRIRNPDLIYPGQIFAVPK